MRNHIGKGMDAYHLKVFAIITMIIDHGYKIFMPYIATTLLLVLPSNVVFYGVTLIFGFTRMTFPIFAYFIAQGVQYTSNRWNYIKRLLCFACVSEIPFQWMICSFQGEPLSLHLGFTNVLFTLFLGALSIVQHDIVGEKTNHSCIAYIPLFLCVITSLLLKTDYAGFGVIAIFLCYFIKNEKRKFTMYAILIALFTLVYTPLLDLYSHLFYVQYIPVYIIDWVFMTCSIVLLKRYNGCRGKQMKYFFYLFYPIHMLILVLIYQFIS